MLADYSNQSNTVNSPSGVAALLPEDGSSTFLATTTYTKTTTVLKMPLMRTMATLGSAAEKSADHTGSR